ncbi:hypothetical protein [Microbacterium sp. bgisy189]|uniref:hypothetical protein n=1 Tax=Microbacterium sp. bgisy189 TaxID=3413798 RepID=UPI003EBEEB06
MAPARAQRSTIVLAVIAGVLAVAVIVTMIIAMNRGGSSTPASEQTTTGEAPVETTETAPSDDASTPPAETDGARIEVSGTGFTLTDAAGSEVYEHDWAAEAQPAIDALSEAFGSEPTEDFLEGDAENWAYDIYDWNGFRLYDVRLGEGNRPRDEIPAPTYVDYTANTVGEVTIADEFGIEIGMSVADAQALGPDAEDTADGSHTQLVFGTDRGTFWNDGVRTFSAFAKASADAVTGVTYTFYQGER